MREMEINKRALYTEQYAAVNKNKEESTSRIDP